jgi:pilus assembly protein CpaE
MVLQASMPYVRAARRLQDMLVSLAYSPERLRLLLNRHRRHDERAASALEQVLGKRPSHVIADDPHAASEAVNLGEPLLKVARNSALSRGVQALAQSIVNQSTGVVPQKKQGEPLLGRLFGRSATQRQSAAS